MDQLNRRIDQVLEDPSASDWLKSSLQQARTRDPVDAVRDAYVLFEILKDGCDEALRSAAELIGDVLS